MTGLAMRTVPYQRGGALLVAMVMIFMLSLMGISAIRSSSLESRMSDNAVQAATSFQTAESSTDIVLNDPARLNEVLLSSDRQATYQTEDALKYGNEAMQSHVRLTFVGTGTPLGNDIGVGANNFKALRFEAIGVSSIDAVGARTTIRQGAYRIGPH